MSGKERGGRIRRGRQHLPRNSRTSTSSLSMFSASPPLYSSSPYRWQESATYSYPPALQECLAPPRFPDVVGSATVIASITATGPNSVSRSRATAKTTPTPTPTPVPVTQSPEEGKDRAGAKTDESAEEKATGTSKKSQKKRYKRRPGRSRRKPGRKTPGNVRATCGNCKRPKNHMMTPSKPHEKETTVEKGDGNWKDIDSDRESLICACDEVGEVRRAHERNSYVDGETPGSPEGIFRDLVVQRRGFVWLG